MRLTTFFKAGMLPICAIIISLAPFTTFSQPQTSFLAHTYNNASSSILISDTAYVDSSMMNANVPVADFYMLGESGNSTILYHLDPVNLRADQAISSLGTQAKPKSWMLPKEVWVETKEEENDAIWDIVTRKESEGTAMYPLGKLIFESTDTTAFSVFTDMELIDMLAIVLLVDVFGLSWYLNRNRSLKLAHITITYAMAYCLLLNKPL